jgi:hypothetical protein
MTATDFWLNFASNSLATILGLIIGIPTALLIERLLEKWRNQEQFKQTQVRINDLLSRTLVQVTNAELRLKPLQNDDENKYMIYAFFGEVDLIESLHRELTNLEADWDLLLSIDIVISDLKSINSLLAVNRDIFAIKMGGRASTMKEFSNKLDDEFHYRKALTLDAINDFRKLMSEQYPGYVNRFQPSKSA